MSDLDKQPLLGGIQFVLFVLVIYFAAKPTFTRNPIRHTTAGLFLGILILMGLSIIFEICTTRFRPTSEYIWEICYSLTRFYGPLAGVTFFCCCIVAAVAAFVKLSSAASEVDSTNTE